MNAPARTATWLARDVTREFRDEEGAAMDDSVSSTHTSLSGTGGEVFPLCRLKWEKALMGVLVSLVKERTGASGFGGVGRGEAGTMGVCSHNEIGVSLLSVLYSTTERYKSSWVFARRFL